MLEKAKYRCEDKKGGIFFLIWNKNMILLRQHIYKNNPHELTMVALLQYSISYVFNISLLEEVSGYDIGNSQAQLKPYN